MKISIITPTFDSEETISENVKSVIEQSYKEFEHIIIDNKSSDNTISIIKKLYEGKEDQLKLISEKDEGIADAFNKGILNAVGNIITILNSDDHYYDGNVFNDVIEKFLDEKIFFVHGDIYARDPIYGSVIKYPYMSKVETGMPYNHPTMFFRKEVYETIGLFDISFKYAMDFELICRFENKFGNLNKKGYYLKSRPLVVMEYGGTSWKNAEASLKETEKALKKNKLWSWKAFIMLKYRILKTKTKQMLVKFGLEKAVKTFREKKWKTDHPRI